MSVVTIENHGEHERYTKPYIRYTFVHRDFLPTVLKVTREYKRKPDGSGKIAYQSWLQHCSRDDILENVILSDAISQLQFVKSMFHQTNPDRALPDSGKMSVEPFEVEGVDFKYELVPAASLKTGMSFSFDVEKADAILSEFQDMEKPYGMVFFDNTIYIGVEKHWLEKLSKNRDLERQFYVDCLEIQRANTIKVNLFSTPLYRRLIDLQIAI